MKNHEHKEKLKELRIATALLWSAFVVSILLISAGIINEGIINDIHSEPSIFNGYIIGFIIGLSFLIFEAFAIYFFTLMRNWARIAILILFLMKSLDSLSLPMEFANSILTGSLLVSSLLMQAIAMYLAFTKPGSLQFQPVTGEDAAMRTILPVGRSGWAIAAGYSGLLSVLILPAPFALVFGVLGIRDIRRHPEKHGLGRAIFGIVMGVFGVIVLLSISISL